MTKYFYRKRKLIIFASLFDLIGNVVFGIARLIIRKGKSTFPEKIKKILLIRLDHLGDVLYVTPALSILRKQYPLAHITLLVSSWGKEIIANNPYIDEIVVYDAPWFQRGKKRGGLVQLFRLILDLRKQKYDLAIDFKGYLWNILLIYLSGAKYKMSYGDVGGKFLLDMSLPRRTDLHAVQQNIEMLRSIGIHFEGKPAVYLNIRKEDINSIEKILKEFNIKEEKMIAVHCGAGRATKMWPIQKFNELINKLSREFPEFEIVLVGGKGEEELVSKLVFAGKRPKSLIGKTNLNELTAFLKKCMLFIGNDSGPAHLAGAMDIATIVLFSKEDDPIEWRPWGEKVTVLQKEPHQFRSLSEKEIKASLDKIEVDEVLNKAKAILR